MLRYSRHSYQSFCLVLNIILGLFLERKLQRDAARSLRRLDVGDTHVEQHDSPGHLEWATRYVDGILDDVITCVVKDVPASWPSYSSISSSAIGAGAEAATGPGLPCTDATGYYP